MAAFDEYRNKLLQALKAGNATEHTHRPALKAFIEALAPAVVATNEPQKIDCGSPDFIVTRKATPLGYIEAKDVGADLARVENSEQLQRYRGGLRNLILTDYLAFRLYRNSELVQTARLGKWQQKTGVLQQEAGGRDEVEGLLKTFFDADVPTISTPRELAERMARLARLIEHLTKQVFGREASKGDLHSQHESFRKVLIADLTVDQFADMYAQTIAYGLFAARCNHIGPGFSRMQAGKELPKTNPFLRRLFNTIAGADLDDRIAWAVDDLAELLARADMPAILADFGKATRREDPVVHFYETFLAAYDPKLRETRGVYYTPEPVVDYIVRSVDMILQERFTLKDGLADQSVVKILVPNGDGKKPKTVEKHRVQILDPACGTGTFLHSVIAQIRERFTRSKGLWPGYVAKHLLPRLYGFELLMAPYAVAHMKLGLQLRETDYDFAADERLRVFLTNSLEEAHPLSALPTFAQWLADEAAAASEVKRDAPIMVVLGNPPYSGHSANQGPWIEGLMETYKRSAELKKPAQAKWLSDDYVKFIRFAQWRIEHTGYGVLGFITNHRYLDNPTFLDMRASLMATFDDIYLLDLHGNTRNKELPPEQVSKDENVFDIQQGVAICLMVRRQPESSGTTYVHHADLWGERQAKYEWLMAHDINSTSWNRFEPIAPRRLFVPQDAALLAEYERGWSIVAAMSRNGDPAPGVVTTHDEFAISWSREEAVEKVERFLATSSEEEARSIWRLCSQSQWSYTRAKQDLSGNDWRDHVVPILYRPFDTRWTIYDRNVSVHRRERVMNHMLRPNMALVTARSNKAPTPDHVFCATTIVETKCGESTTQSTTIPLWLYGTETGPLYREGHDSRLPNYSREFLEYVGSRIGAVSPEDTFAYCYAILYSPRYRIRYSAFLRRDFPRVPIAADAGLFRRLATLGQKLIDLHVMRAFARRVPTYPVPGTDRVEKPGWSDGRVYINADQYFGEVPEAAWNYSIGGYQVGEKWLKDRKDRVLTFEDLEHYARIVGALDETIEIQGEIDTAIEGLPVG